MPSSLTAPRIKDILGLAKSHERALLAALDAGASSSWRETAEDDDFYSRLRSLLATVRGRQAYDEARRKFEKGKRAGRADFLSRLKQSCWNEVLEPSQRRDTGRPSESELFKRLAAREDWARMAEALWMEGLLSGNAERLQKTTATYPRTSDYLETVHAGLVCCKGADETGAPEDDDEEPAALVERIRQTVAEFSVDRLDERELRTLSNDVLRLADLVKAREIKARTAALLQARVEEWEKENAEAIRDTDEILALIAALKAGIQDGHVSKQEVEDALGLANRYGAVDASYRETQENLKKAVDEVDFASVRRHNDDLEELDIELKAIRTELTTGLARSPSEVRASDFAPNQGGTSSDGAAESAADTVEPKLASDKGAEIDEVSNERVAGKNLTDLPNLDTDDSPTESNVTCDADRMEQTEEQEVGPNIDNAIANAIDRHRFGLAYHLSCLAPGAFLSANTVKLVACNYVTDERAPVGPELSYVAAAALDELKASPGTGSNSQHRLPHAILTICAALRPALTAPGGPVAELLVKLEPTLGDMRSLRALAKTAAEVSIKGVYLPVGLLREEDSLEGWTGRLISLEHEIEAWLTSERQSTIKFQAATRVWRRILEDWEHEGRSSLGQVFSLLDVSGDDINKSRISDVVGYWRANREKEIDRIDRDLRSRVATKRIEGAARVALRSKIDQALALLDRWISILEEQPDKQTPFHVEQAKLLRNSLRDNASDAIGEILAAAGLTSKTAVALVKRYASIFEGDDGLLEDGEVSLPDLLNGDLFR